MSTNLTTDRLGEVDTSDIFSQLGVSRHVTGVLRAAAQAARGEGQASAMTHAWLFTGPPGSGRSVAAVGLAASLVCEHETVVGCGTCTGCKAVLAGTHGDVLHIVPRELSISVDTMRQAVIEPAAKRPTVAKWRVVILDNADRLTEGAANALLKTVEEPPAHTVIMMCAPSTDPQDVMPTLLSRSRHVYVPQPSEQEVADILSREGISPDDARLAAAATGRHIGRARHLATDREAQTRRANILRLAELVFQGDQAFQAVTAIVKASTKSAEEALAKENETEMEKLRNALGMGAKGKGAQKALRGASGQIRELEEKQKKRRTRAIRDTLDLALVDLAGLYRDSLMDKSATRVPAVHPDFAGLAAELSARVDVAGLVACLDAITLAREHLQQNVRPETALDAMVGRLRIACGAGV
nr:MULTISPECIES: DNA polymerase III subunit delta' [unclassified Corynebacterium]